jgi:transcriptional regulator with XRE-family HTH domain
MEDLRMAQWLDAMIAMDGTKINDLAKHVGVSVSQISKWKSGEQALKKPEHIFKIAEFFEVDEMRLLATADPSFQDRGFDPLPVPEIGHDHLVSRLPRYIGDRERRLMGRIARLGARAKAVNGNPTDRIEDTFIAIDEMLDTISSMLDDKGESDDRGAPKGRGASGSDKPPGRGAGVPSRKPGRERGSRSGGIEASYWATLQSALAPGW